MVSTVMNRDAAEVSTRKINSFRALRVYFSVPGKPCSVPEFLEFWDSLTPGKERAYYMWTSLV